MVPGSARMMDIFIIVGVVVHEDFISRNPYERLGCLGAWMLAR